MRRALVATLVIVKVFLVVRLGVIPGARHEHFGSDGFARVPFLTDLLFDLFSGLQLLFGRGENGGAILGASVGSLTVQGSGIMHAEEEFGQLAESYCLRVVDNQEGLGMAGGAGADSSVRRVVGITSNVAHTAVEKTFPVAPAFAV